MTAAAVPVRVPAAPTGTVRAVRDLRTMTRRSMLRALRQPSNTVMLVALPVVLLLLFVYVFGGAFGAGVAPGAEPGAEGRAAYLAYITPAILVMTGASMAMNTSISVAMDMTGGMVTRLRTMPVSPVAVLGGHVVGAVLQTLLAAGGVLGTAVLLGFRPGTDALAWLGLLGFLTLFALMLTWLSVAMGAAARSVEGASNTPMVFMLFTFFGSGFAPVGTMPGPVRFFAEHQPLTPVIETLRGLLAGSLDTSTAWTAVTWCVTLSVAGALWARSAYRRPRT
jgi:ABC-2 type transport system permease protein